MPEPLHINPNRLAKPLAVDRQNVYEIVGGKCVVSSDMALRPARWFGVRVGSRPGLQADYDLRMAAWRRDEEIAEQAVLLSATSQPGGSPATTTHLFGQCSLRILLRRPNRET